MFSGPQRAELALASSHPRQVKPSYRYLISSLLQIRNIIQNATLEHSQGQC